jgi:hypothetical protein
MSNITFTPLNTAFASFFVRKPDEIQDANSSSIPMTWTNLMRHELAKVKAIASENIKQYGNRDNYYRVIADPGAQLCKVEWEEKLDPRLGYFPPNDTLPRTLYGVLHIVNSGMNRGSQQLSLMLFIADDVYFSNSTETQSVTGGSS